MKKLFFLLPVLALLGCIEFTKDVYKVYYHGGSATAGIPPVDSREYTYGETVTVLGQGSLTNGDHIFLGWRHYTYYSTFYSTGDKLTIWEDINLYAVWDDGLDSPFSFKIENGEAIITRYNEINNRYVTFPDTLQGKPVTAIDDSVFSNLTIFEVRLPKHLKRIGIGAFANNALDQIFIPDSVESVGMGAFRDNLLKKITFGEGLAALEAYAFSNNLLKDIIVPENIKTISAGAFMGNDIVQIKLGSGVDIKNDTALGTHGASFRAYYDNEGKKAGLYLYIENDIWDKL